MIRRCRHSLVLGLCVVPSCEGWEGDVDPQSTAPRACLNCGRATHKSLCGDCSKSPAIAQKYQLRRMAVRHA
jgi:hypothetical protein